MPRLCRGDFILLRRLGGGAQGLVRAAAPVSPAVLPGSPHAVALKTMPLRGSNCIGPCAESARRELDAHTAASGHRHVATLYGAFRDRGRMFLVSELLEGGDLRGAAHLWPDGLPVATAVHIVRQLADALRHLHARGVAHSDLKPENVLLARPLSVWGCNEVKLVDFGIATRFCPRQRGGPLVTAVGGTPGYMSREVRDAEPHDPTRSDVYALGILLYELVCGDVPVDGRGSADAGRSVLLGRDGTDVADGFEAVDEPVLRWLRRLLRQMLQSNWRKRPSAAEVFEALHPDRFPHPDSAVGTHE